MPNEYIITECVSVSAFASLAGIPVGILSSAAGLKFRNNCRIWKV